MAKTKETYPKEADLLESWKEISKYLNRDIKTCQRWEIKFGLPIHRLEGSPRSRVFAYRHELDTWFKGKFTNSLDQSKQKRSNFNKIKSALALAGIIIAAAVVTLLIKINENSKEIADFRIEGSKLIFLNNKKRPIAEFDTNFDNLQLESHYKSYADNRYFTHEANFLPLMVRKDLDQNGKKEFLFAVYTIEHTRSDKLFCFSPTGEMIWEFKAGKMQKFGGEIYPDDYRILGIGAEDLNQDGKLEIIVLANHLNSFPSQMILLDYEGRKIGEYWNSGHLTDYSFYDINDDGTKEIILTGQNEEYRKPCSIVLDLNYISGCSPQDNYQYRCEDYTFSREKYYLLLPIEAARNLVMDKIAPIRIDYSNEDPSEFLSFKNLITYYFDSNMFLKKIDLIRRAHLDLRKYQRKGTISKNSDQIIAELLEEGALYFNGRTWVSEPTTTEFWISGKPVIEN